MSQPKTATVIVASTRAAAGTYQDRSGPIAVDFLRSLGFETPDPIVVADADIDHTIAAELQTKPSVLLTSGGTGITPDDRTVEAAERHITRPMPGITVAFWNQGLKNVPTAALSRAVAGVNDHTFIMTLPGSTGGVKDGCAVLEPLLGHITDMLEGHHEH